MVALPPLESLEFARFKTLTGPAAQRVEFDVHFNPESLQHTVQSTLKEEGQGAKKKQHVSQTTAKLSMQLVFDTTDTGEDVRRYTDKVAKLMKPVGSGKEHVPPLVEFGWGVYRFTGLVEQYQETIDFFAAGGVPLRSTVDLTLASQDVSFDSTLNPSASVDSGLSGSEPAVFLRGGVGLTAGIGGAAGLAVSLGDPRSARSIASLNGSASLRFDTSAELAVGSSVSLQGPAAFASGGAGIVAGAGASGGAFARLRAAPDSTRGVPDGRTLFGASANIGTGANTPFAPGGRAEAQSGASLSANVGAMSDPEFRFRSR
jgi:hypothetical protein